MLVTISPPGAETDQDLGKNCGRKFHCEIGSPKKGLQPPIIRIIYGVYIYIYIYIHIYIYHIYTIYIYIYPHHIYVYI